MRQKLATKTIERLEAIKTTYNKPFKLFVENMEINEVEGIYGNRQQ